MTTDILFIEPPRQIGRRMRLAGQRSSRLKLLMVRQRPDSGWRAMVLAAALFAVTLNLLQPVVHAALMRYGPAAALWSTICNAAVAVTRKEPESAPLPSTLQDHECCLGLAHARALIDPPASFLPLVFAASMAKPLPASQQSTSKSIRDGPHRPRGPPSLV